ncbi:alpha/beta hydrolase [Actinomadura sp. ATCC 31491]|uniref:Alpha/beta hydrolase n=1 Tax=Actinomadura luzonensis TaxID=2805427 RepID=A0ABT0FZS5_9ACTN|nr:alpha/beta fold hydrolase [Actinomadura luzonensis]MCK2217832.1 alpha/beta hydrolase [Actinomadura luzonensis]
METGAAYTPGSVTSADGTVIGYRKLGSDGPALILLSGGYLAAQHYMELARELSRAFTVYVPDRRGRGRSGPPGPDYRMARECEDVEALVAATGARLLFGHSSGGLIALQASLALPAIDKIAVYEPALSMYGAFSMSWIPRFERELDQGRLAAAMVTFSKGVRANRTTDLVPRRLLVPLIDMYLRRQAKPARPDEQPLSELIPLQRMDVQIFQEMSTSKGFAALTAQTLLMEGGKTPPPLHRALDALQATLAQTQRITFSGVGHEAPIDERGAAARVAAASRAFFARS